MLGEVEAEPCSRAFALRLAVRTSTTCTFCLLSLTRMKLTRVRALALSPFMRQACTVRRSPLRAKPSATSVAPKAAEPATRRCLAPKTPRSQSPLDAFNATRTSAL